jgi:hypothetical protein
MQGLVKENRKTMEICLKIIKIKGWKNGHLIPFVEAALEGNLALEYTDFKDLDKMLKEFKKHNIEL